jgi:hypothetical protein
MTAYKDLYRHPKRNDRKHLCVQKASAHISDFGPSFAGGPFRQAVRAAIPRRPTPRSR